MSNSDVSARRINEPKLQEPKLNGAKFSESEGIHVWRTMMRYLCLIYADEAIQERMTEEERSAMFGAYGAFTEDLEKAGSMLGGEALQATSTATTVQVRNGNTITIDGPFAETKEQLGGFYMIEAKDLDEAIAWAAKIPSAATGSIEVRPIMEFGEGH